ncbi:breast cancer metastasis-suppressor 1-like protein isoform X3 [Cebus imitator]|uniref:Breast cancer metastasis-suppressor 1-like protein isoform X3 n=1 Tax=Sapajus apella TaxID=9515 RepID=A0A6J3EYK6_SAPAP|nr:breast cancer metastasis-suppressor 1-like protein isoform X3 [Sapajus apella]XP_037595296.1 breast cancer metastasis-suppressor 1-like protein isoform X3 [Cebus imitator]
MRWRWTTLKMRGAAPRTRTRRARRSPRMEIAQKWMMKTVKEEEWNVWMKCPILRNSLPISKIRIYRELCLESVKNKYECEIQASRQHCESEKLLLYDTVQSELEEKIRRLEEDRHSIDITSELWNDELQSRKKRKDPFSPDKKKPVVVSGPYIVYMLQDLDILEDWTTIRKAMATLGPHRVKTEPPVKLEKHLHSARSEEGRLYYDGEWYIRGQTICIDKKDECPTSAVITTINHDEVWFKRPDGSKSKLYISQLQKGKYSIKHS